MDFMINFNEIILLYIIIQIYTKLMFANKKVNYYIICIFNYSISYMIIIIIYDKSYKSIALKM